MNFFILIISYFLIVTSIIGYGLLFSFLINKNYLTLNIGYLGIFGYFFLSFISYFTNLFIPHSETHNLLIHVFGIGFFIFQWMREKNIAILDLKKEYKFTIIIFLVSLLGLFLSKNHDDFPYYHLSYTLNLVEYKLQFGLGNLNHGFNTTSSLFYFNSLLYFPFLKLYLYNSTTLILLSFSNLILLKEIIKDINLKDKNFIFYFRLFSLIFINVVFYRVAEHGIDRTGQILAFILFILSFEIFNEKKNKKASLILEKILIFLGIIISLKSYFISYLIFLPVIFFNLKNKIDFKKIFFSKLIIFIFIGGALYFNSNFSNSACLIYPLESTCINSKEKISWSQSKSHVKKMSNWYELWSKAGANPNFRTENPKEYIKKFNWVDTWFDKYFFNKVSDTLLGVLFIIFILFILFFGKKGKINKKINFKLIFLSIIFLFLIWFFKHPTLRYGGFVLLSSILFIPASIFLSKRKMKISRQRKITYGLIFLTFFIFNFRNVNRINKEINVYNYKPFTESFFKMDNVEFKKKLIGEDIYLNQPIDNMCWNVPTPCSHRNNIKAKKVYGYNVYTSYEK